VEGKGRTGRSGGMFGATTEKKTGLVRALVMLAWAGAVLQGYAAGYVYARVTHRLVRQSPMCDSDRIILGAGARGSWAVLYTPAMGLEGGFWTLREAWW
jgi:hypothetical protein